MSIPETNSPINRFQAKSQLYLRYRPTYPESYYVFLRESLGLQKHHTIADIGSGTGFSSKRLIENGNTVYAVEPNTEMRLSAERLFARHNNFHSLNGSAEKTNLPDDAVDFIIIGQAFHWFDQAAAKAEIKRILKPGGQVIIAWNERLTDTSECAKQFENLLLRYATDYLKVDHRNISESMLAGFFGHKQYQYRAFQNCQVFSWEGLKGRLLSMSYAPQKGEASHEAILAQLDKMFRDHAICSQVKLDYLTRVYFGTLAD